MNRTAGQLRICTVVFLSSIAGLLRAGDVPKPPQLTAIYPSGHELPANHLKFYLHFAQPMRQGVFLDHIKLLDDHGHAVIEPFRETELWNEDGTRLTLWFHPGRQKTGVNLNEELGPIVEPGRRYKLVISGRWPSADGIPLGRDVEKGFITSERATSQLVATFWKIIPPAAGTKQALQTRFPAPLDHALLLSCLNVRDLSGRQVMGDSDTSEGETVWRFTPNKPWVAGEFELIAKSTLEDLAGNSLARPFQVDLTSGINLQKCPSEIPIRFRTSSATR